MGVQIFGDEGNAWRIVNGICVWLVLIVYFTRIKPIGFGLFSDFYYLQNNQTPWIDGLNIHQRSLDPPFSFPNIYHHKTVGCPISQKFQTTVRFNRLTKKSWRTTQIVWDVRQLYYTIFLEIKPRMLSQLRQTS